MMEARGLRSFLLLALLLLAVRCGGVREYNGTLNVAIVLPLATRPHAANQVTYSPWHARALASVVFAIEQVNNKSDGHFDRLLPNTTIVYEYYDYYSGNGDGDLEIARFAADIKYRAFGGEGADVILGAGSSSKSITLQSIAKYFSLPQVSGFASSGRLSNDKDFPFFLRTVPTDKILANAMVEFAKRKLGCESAAIIHGDDSYSQYGAADIVAAAKRHDMDILCKSAFQTRAPEEMDLGQVALSGANVFIFFGQETSIVPFLRALYTALLPTQLLRTGFVIIFPDVYLGTNVELAFQQANESHIYEAMSNGTFALSQQRSGEFTPTFNAVFKERLKSLWECTNVSCGCGNGMVDRRTNRSVFLHTASGGSYCAIVDPEEALSYYDAFLYDSVVFVASVVHEMMGKGGRKYFDGADFMNTSTGPTFKVHGLATGSVQLQPNGDRSDQEYACNVFNERVPRPTTAGPHLAHVGALTGTGPAFKFTFCVANASATTFGCRPSLSFNTPDNRPPPSVHSSISTLRLGIVTGVFRPTVPLQADTTGAQRTMAMLMAIDEISNRADGIFDELLPSTAIQFEWLNSERDAGIATLASASLASQGFEGKGAIAVVGGFSSGPTIAMQAMLKHSGTLQISPSATSVQLSDARKFPGFLRTAQSDALLVKHIVGFAKTFMEWNAVGIFSDSSAYSKDATAPLLAEAALQDLQINIHLKLDPGLANLKGEVDRAVGSNTRGYIIIAPADTLKRVMGGLAAAAELSDVDIGTFCFLLSDSAFGLPGLPAIANGSFVFRHYQNTSEGSAAAQMTQRAKAIVQNVSSCGSRSNGSSTACDCIPDHWKPVFQKETQSETLCAFPTAFADTDRYTPLSYDAILAIARLQHDLIEQGNSEITSELLKLRALDPAFNFHGVAGTIAFDAVGDRRIDGLATEVLNVEIRADMPAFGKIGVLGIDAEFQRCHDPDCKPSVCFGTKLNEKPIPVATACNVDADCSASGRCRQDGACACASGFIGINCQHVLFPRLTYESNTDGSKRCFQHVEPLPPMAIAPIRVCYFGWKSQTLISDLTSVLLTEVMHRRVEKVHMAYGVDYIEALARNHCHVFMEEWFARHVKDSSDLYIQQTKQVLDVGRTGYFGKAGWYVNRASLDKESMRLSYTSFRKREHIEAMRNLPVPYDLVQNCTAGGVQNSCNPRTGTYTNDAVCAQSDFGCGAVYAADVSYEKNVMQRQVSGMGLNLKVVWLGDANVKAFVKANVHSKHPFIFFWWVPDEFISSFADNEIYRLELPAHDDTALKTTGVSDFPTIKMRNLVYHKLPKQVVDFLSNFKITENEINALFRAAAETKGTAVSASCQWLGSREMKRRALSFVPMASEEANSVRLGVTVTRVSSLIMGKLLQILIGEHLGMKVTVQRTFNDAHSLELVEDGSIDVVAEALFKTQSETEMASSFAFSSVYGDRGGLYAHFPGAGYDARAREIGKTWYLKDELVKYMAPNGTYSPSPGQCSLWWCNNPLGRPGTFSPTHCIDQSRPCGEILVGSALNGFHRWSILAEIIETLRLPFIMVFVKASVIAAALESGSFVTIFYSATRVQETDSTLRYRLPQYSTQCFTGSEETQYDFANRKLGTYACDFPDVTAYVLGNKKRVEHKVAALHSLLERVQLPGNSMDALKAGVNVSSSDQVITETVRAWLHGNSGTWGKWVHGCDDVPGQYGIWGKCSECPRGQYSAVGSNTCELCPSGTYANYNGTVFCTLCPAKTYTANKGSVRASQCLCIDGLIGNADAGCSSCPKNAICRRGRPLVPQGYWRFNKDSDEVFECPTPSTCLGVAPDSTTEDDAAKEGCAHLFRGKLCSKCERGYFKTLVATCEKCYPKSIIALVNTLSVVLMFVVVAVGIKYSRSKAPELDMITSKLEKLRKQVHAADVCVFTRETDGSVYRFLDHVSGSTPKTRKHRSNRRVSITSESLFNVTKAISLVQSPEEKSVSSGTLPRKFNINAYPYLKGCVTATAPRIVRDPAAPSVALFHEVEEIIVCPITTDLQHIGGILMASFAKHETNALDFFRQEKIFRFVKISGGSLISQCEDHRAILFKILLCHFQVYAASRHLVVPWSVQMSYTFEATEYIAGMFSSFAANECSLDSICGGLNSLYCKSIVVFTLPLILFAGFYLIGTLYIRLKFPGAGLNRAKQTLNRLAGLSTMIVLYYMHGAFTSAAFALIPCRELGRSGLWLYSDYDIQCDSPERVLWSLCLLIPVFLLYIVGIPFALAYAVYVNKNALGNFNTRRFIGILYNGYQLQYYWWEAVILLRKACIIGIIHGLSAYTVSAQTTAILMLLTTSMLLEYTVQPYAWSALARTERMVLGVETLTFFLASLHGNGVLRGNSGRSFLEFSIVFMNVALISIATFSASSGLKHGCGEWFLGCCRRGAGNAVSKSAKTIRGRKQSLQRTTTIEMRAKTDNNDWEIQVKNSLPETDGWISNPLRKETKTKTEQKEKR
jgi:ABC-type branched-subunit amino acid transport system substrate-binding protein/ABC-type proline/glycine betaine transport system substrate-binding protein